MRNKNMKINCWELKNGKEIPLLPTSTLDGFEWNGKYRLIVSNDDGSLGLPFLFATDDTAILTVETSEQDGMGTDDKKIKQLISCVPRSLGNEITCSRIRSYNGKEHVWSEWKLASSSTGTTVEWDSASCIDSFVTAGVYNITGERLNASDGLPIENSAPGHTIHARLTVLDSSIAGTGDSHDKCVTQVLTLSNRTGGDGDVYIRTGRASIKNQLAGGTGWEPWGKLQQNIEVGQVTSLNSFTGNGIYSGVYTNGSTFFETFVMVVINNYAVAGVTGQVRSISQFKYALNVDGTFSYKTRTGQGSSVIEWGSWVDLGAATTTDIQDGAITAQKLSSDVREKVDNPLRPFYIAAGAEYNDSGADKTKTAPWGETVTHKAGHYYLNGLGDITEEQMMLIYALKDSVYRLNVMRLLQNERIRTIFPVRNLAILGQVLGKSPLTTLVFYDCSSLEVLMWGNQFCTLAEARSDYTMPVGAGSFETFHGCKKLKIIYPLNCYNVTNFSGCFKDCNNLREVRLYKVKVAFSLSESNSISKSSILYAIQNAIPNSAITITLHSDAYTRLADDADIVAALEAQPLVSLVSA